MTEKNFNKLTPQIEESLNSEINSMINRLFQVEDTIMILLKFHLWTEQMLERLLASRLPRPDRLEDAGLRYYQKLNVVNSLECIEDETFQFLKRLNSLRNKCSHQEVIINRQHLDNLGQPLSKVYREFCNRGMDDQTLMRNLFGRAGSSLVAKVYVYEHYSE